MIYAIRFYHFGLTSDPIYLDGPEADLVDIWNSFNDLMDLKPEPNTFSYGQHKEWMLTKTARLKEFQVALNCTGDFDALFIELLIKEYYFKRIIVKQVQL